MINYLKCYCHLQILLKCFKDENSYDFECKAKNISEFECKCVFWDVQNEFNSTTSHLNATNFKK